MALTDAQYRVASLALHLPEAAGFVLAGGGAMLVHELVDRPTRDLDLFTTDLTALAPFAGALTAALTAAGLTVTPGRVADGYQQLTVVDGGEAVLVELAHDARLWPASTLAVGPVISVVELAADKTLALFGRAEPRDLVDVAALATNYSTGELLESAAAKDAGFDPNVLADAVGFAAAQPDSRFLALGLTPMALLALREWAQRWREELIGEQAEGHAQAARRPSAAAQLAAAGYPDRPRSGSPKDDPPHRRQPPESPTARGRSR